MSGVLDTVLVPLCQRGEDSLSSWHFGPIEAPRPHALSQYAPVKMVTEIQTSLGEPPNATRSWPDA